MPTTPSPTERPSYIDQLRAETRGLPYRPAKRKKRPEPEMPSPEDSHRLFTVEKGSRWMELARREPKAKMLFGELWHQGELCMLFADSNIGKSVLAVQIGESIARGRSIAPFPCQAPPARVLYIDFELTRAQFGLRYSNGDDDHIFSDNFYRAEYNFIPDPPPNVDENALLIAAIEYKVRMTKATVLIIDNITCLRGGTENSVVALSLMKSLKTLKTDHKLSILVLAHTPKRRNPTQPISADDLHGSKLLINFADSAFAIGKSTTGNHLCYLKQIKQRNTRQRYGDDNVCLCRIQKPGTFLHFKFEGYSAEHHHLQTRTAAARQQLAKKVAALTAGGLSQREISKQLGIGLGTVNRLIECADVQMRGCADEEGFEDLKISQFENEGGWADVQMRGCADEDKFEDFKISQFEDYADDPMTNDQKGYADDPMTNDQKGYADDPMTNDQNGLTNYTIAVHTPTDDIQSTTPGANCFAAASRTTVTPYILLPQVLMRDVQTTMTHLNPNPDADYKTSIIEILLSPVITEHLERTIPRANSIPVEGSNSIWQPNHLSEAEADNGGV